MMPPPGFQFSLDLGKLYWLRCSLYGLKQSPRAWVDRFDIKMTAFGFSQSVANHTLFLRHYDVKICCTGDSRNPLYFEDSMSN